MPRGLVDTRGSKLVLEHLEELIESEALGPGDQLPTERTLEQTLGCTRTDVRRALSQLEIDGRVVRHVGRGTFLASVSSEPPPESQILTPSPTELMAARLLLEPRVASMAALTATQDDFLEMQRCLDGGDSTDVYEEFEGWDIALHRSFALAAHNSIVTAMVGILHSSRLGPVWGGLKRRTFSAARCVDYRREHHEIVEALQDRDAQAAEDAMVRHLDSVRRTILG